MSFLAEIKRRNVAKVAVLYLIASWLLLQVTDVLASLLPVPDWAGSLVVMLLLLGFVPVLIFSWVYEMTPEGLRKEKDIDRTQSVTPQTGRKINVLIIVLLVLAIAAVAIDRMIPETTRIADTSAHDVSGTSTQPAMASVPAASEQSIAVLPFVNMSSDPEQEYFSDGLSEELLNLLAKIPDLQVAARTSSFSLKGKELQMAEVGEILKVAHVLEGSVRKSGNQVRITAQLIHAADGYHLWSETYDRRLDDIFAIQDEIAAEVVDQLKITLLGEAPKVIETDPEAYALVLQARQLNHQGTAESWERSLELYQQALAIAPDYAPAWAGISNVYLKQGSNMTLRSIAESNRLALEAAEKSIALDPDYAPGYMRLGDIIIQSNGELAEAGRLLQQGVELDPTNPEFYANASNFLRVLGRLDEAIELMEYVIARDPVNPTHHFYLGLYNQYELHADEAITAYRKTLALSPDRVGANASLAGALLLKGEPEAALAAVQKEESLWKQISLPMVYHALGMAAESDAALAILIEEQEQDAAYNIAYVLADRGEADRAFEWLDKAVEYNDPGLQDIAIENLFTNIHDDPRWLPFLESIGKSPEQMAMIEFNVKMPE
ncbi:MAG: tetratricopeptide repeat protein [Gammaproteobacteria bacterium]